MRRKRIIGKLRKVPRRYWDWLPSQDRFKFEDIMVVRIKYSSVSLFKMWKTEYWDYMWDHMWDENRLPKEFEEVEQFFERIIYDVFDEEGFGCFIQSGGDGSYCPVMGAHFSRPYVYNKRYYLVMVLDKKFTLNPFSWKEESDSPKCFYVNKKKLETFSGVEVEIRNWLNKLKNT